MVKRADIRVQVPRCSAQTFWDVVYEKPEATERYHLSYNESSAPSATDWSAGQRRVSFRMPLSLPELVKRMVGLESVEVTEVQRVVWGGSGSFTVSSETHVTNLMGASRFTTSLQLTATEQPEEQPAPPASAHHDHAGCASPGSAPDGGAASAACSLTLVYSVRCGASSVPWPMSATIENIMAEKALVSMQFFLDFCTQLLDEHQAVAAASSAAERSAAAAAASSPGALETDADSGAVAAAASGRGRRHPSRPRPAGSCCSPLAHPTSTRTPVTPAHTATTISTVGRPRGSLYSRRRSCCSASACAADGSPYPAPPPLLLRVPVAPPPVPQALPDSSLPLCAAAGPASRAPRTWRQPRPLPRRCCTIRTTSSSCTTCSCPCSGSSSSTAPVVRVRHGTSPHQPQQQQQRAGCRQEGTSPGCRLTPLTPTAWPSGRSPAYPRQTPSWMPGRPSVPPAVRQATAATARRSAPPVHTAPKAALARPASQPQPRARLARPT